VNEGLGAILDSVSVFSILSLCSLWEMLMQLYPDMCKLALDPEAHWWFNDLSSINKNKNELQRNTNNLYKLQERYHLGSMRTVKRRLYALVPAPPPVRGGILRKNKQL